MMALLLVFLKKLDRSTFCLQFNKELFTLLLLIIGLDMVHETLQKYKFTYLSCDTAMVVLYSPVTLTTRYSIHTKLRH